ncbi:MAG TPA: MOFRL family protein, partial [Thermoplasmataceae archaeon]|nr:MOFRL family protein [Thermoplasmataceae archaeon]
SPAMGGMVSANSKRSVPEALIDQYLQNSDSYSLLKKFGLAIETGPTGNNVSDIFIGYYGGKNQ